MSTKPEGRAVAAPQESAAARVAKAARGAVAAGRKAASALPDHAVPSVTAVADFVAVAGDSAVAFNPLLGLRGRDVAAAGASLLKVLASPPRTNSRHLGAYLDELRRIIAGKCEAAPDPKDRRFADPAWQTNFVFKGLMQLYLVTQKSLAEGIASSTLDARNRERARFFASLVTDALAPSNWVFANPAAVRKIVDTGGKNLLQGLKNLVHDVRHNGGLPTQVDATPFKVGETIAISPGQVVLRDEMFELLQYTPTTPKLHRRPLVMSPPQINKYYAVDLTPEKSLVKWTVDSGVQLFMVSWRNPTIEQRHWGLPEYVRALDRAVDAARRVTGSPDVNAWGTCSGGMTLAAYLGWLAARGERKVVNTTWAVCVLDMSRGLEDTTLGLFTTPAAIKAAKARSRRRGIVTGLEMARMFAWLRPNDLIWNYWVNNYLLGAKPPAFDILAWNWDTTRLPGQFHVDLLDLVEKNPYVNPGVLEVGGVPIDMSRVEVGAYVIGGITDHITPWKGCYGTARVFGENATFVLANAGHLQSLLNPPGSPKSFFFAGPAASEDPDRWAAAAQRQEGSWWPHWRAWIQARSGELVDGPDEAGQAGFRPLGPAPGTYVLEP